MSPELTAKPIGFILLQDEERQAFYELTERQRGYFLHWWRSNQKRQPDWFWLCRRARAARP